MLFLITTQFLAYI